MITSMIGHIVNRVEEAVASLLLVVMTLIVFVEVVLRFGFNTGMVWTDEVVLYMAAWLVLLGASYGVKVGSHIGVDAVVRLMPSRGRRIMTGAALVLCLFYCWLFIQGAWIYLSKIYGIGIEMNDVPIERWLAESVLLIGFVLLAIRFAMLLLQVILGRADSFSLVDEAREAIDQFEEKPENREA
jgi:C4-dicarboxylate transporter DctQ subunit